MSELPKQPDRQNVKGHKTGWEDFENFQSDDDNPIIEVVAEGPVNEVIDLESTGEDEVEDPVNEDPATKAEEDTKKLSRQRKSILIKANTIIEDDIIREQIIGRINNAKDLEEIESIKNDIADIETQQQANDKERKEKKIKRIEAAKKIGEFAASYTKNCAKYMRGKALDPNYNGNVMPFTESISVFKKSQYDSHKEEVTDPDTEWDEEIHKTLSDKKFAKMNEKDTVKMDKLIIQLKQIVEKISIEETPDFGKHSSEQQEMLKNQAKVAENSKKQYIDNLINTIETGEFTGMPIKSADGNVAVKRVRLSIVDKETREANPSKYHRVDDIAKKEMDQGKFLSRGLDRAEAFKTRGEDLPDYSASHNGDQLRNASYVMGHEKTTPDNEKKSTDLGTIVGNKFVENLEKQAANPGNGVNFFAADKLKNDDGKLVVNGKEIPEKDLWQYRGVNFNGLSDGGVLVSVANLFSETLQHGYNRLEKEPFADEKDDSFVLEEEVIGDGENNEKSSWSYGEKVSFQRSDGSISNGHIVMMDPDTNNPERNVRVEFSEGGEIRYKNVGIKNLMSPISEEESENANETDGEADGIAVIEKHGNKYLYDKQINELKSEEELKQFIIDLKNEWSVISNGLNINFDDDLLYALIDEYRNSLDTQNTYHLLGEHRFHGALEKLMPNTSQEFRKLSDLKTWSPFKIKKYDQAMQILSKSRLFKSANAIRKDHETLTVS